MIYSEKLIDIVIPVYNDSPYLAETINSIISQQFPNGWGFHLYIIDDGSEEPVDVECSSRGNISIVRLEKNSGCSVARNKGASAGNAEVLLFLDADCSLATDNVLALLLEQYLQGNDVCFGQIYAPQGDFWAKYQNNVAKERAVRFKLGEKSSMTTSVFMVDRQAFEVVGGFDEEYHFGFEDRDLFITLVRSGANVSLVERAIVNHNDKLSLISVTKKLHKTGKESSSRFIKKHLREYEEMPYVRADIRYSKGLLMLLVIVTKPLFLPAVEGLNWVIKKDFLPFWLLKKIVKYTSGLAYLQGTAQAKR